MKTPKYEPPGPCTDAASLVTNNAGEDAFYERAEQTALSDNLMTCFRERDDARKALREIAIACGMEAPNCATPSEVAEMVKAVLASVDDLPDERPTSQSVLPSEHEKEEMRRDSDSITKATSDAASATT